MRGIGPTISFAGHAVLLTWGLFSFAPDPFEDQFVDALPVEFVTIADVTDLTKGVKTAEEVNDNEEIVETPQTPAEEVAENPGPAETPVEEPEPEPVQEVAQETVKAQPPEPTPPQPTPEPTPEPEPVEAAQPEPTPEPQPEPEPVEVAQPEPEPQPPEPEKAPEPEKPVEVAKAPDSTALEELIEEELEKPAEKVEAEQPVAEAPTPPAAPVPRFNPKPLKERQVASVDQNKLLNKKDPKTNSGGKPKKTASLGTKTGTRGAKLTQSELDGLRDAIQRCWSLPPGYSAGRDFRAKVKAKLSKDGRVRGKVTVVSVTGYDGGPPILIKKAVRDAITGCAPYKLPQQKYAQWQDLEVTFYP